MDQLPTSSLTLPPITCITGCAAIPAFEYGGCYSWLLLIIIFLSIHEIVNISIWLRLRVHEGVLTAWDTEYTIVALIVLYSFYSFINALIFRLELPCGLTMGVPPRWQPKIQRDAGVVTVKYFTVKSSWVSQSYIKKKQYGTIFAVN